MIKAVFVAGLPYPQPDLMLRDYMQAIAKRLGRNIENDLYTIMAVIRVRQAIGRSIRDPQDRAMIILGDRRFLARNVREVIRLKYHYVVFNINDFISVVEKTISQLELM